MNRPIAWTIGGSDSGAGAGIQADIKTMAAFGVHGCSALTALTAQNTARVSRVEAVSDAMLDEQLTSLSSDLPPQAIKLGMLLSDANMRTVAKHLERCRSFTVLDPVMVATSGDGLIETDAIETLRQVLAPSL